MTDRATGSGAPSGATPRASAWWTPRGLEPYARRATGSTSSTLRAYVNLIENGPDSPATLQREGTDAMMLHARLGAGQSLLVQETWDQAWQATVDGQRVPIRKDQVGFMVVDVPPGDRTVRMEFTMPLENRVGWTLTGLTLIALALLAVRKER